jgi:hypothetical protein
MTSDKTARFAALLPTHDHPAAERGRKPSPFITAPDGGTRFPASRAAYIRRLRHFKLLTAVDHGCPCIDPIKETNRHIGSVRRTLWLYLHDCLPSFAGKEQGLADLLATHNANLLMRGIEKIILVRLQAGLIDDQEFASRILDDTRLANFAARWFSREKGHRAL